MTNLIEDDIYQTEQAFCNITIKLHDQVRIQRRSYTKLINIWGDVGGVMEVIKMIFNLLSFISLDILYENSILNNILKNDNVDKKIQDQINFKNDKFKKKFNKKVTYPDKTLFGNKEISKLKRSLTKQHIKQSKTLIINHPISQLIRNLIYMIKCKGKSKNNSNSNSKENPENISLYVNTIRKNIFINNFINPENEKKNGKDISKSKNKRNIKLNRFCIYFCVFVLKKERLKRING